jgi:hypothetical protein
MRFISWQNLIFSLFLTLYLFSVWRNDPDVSWINAQFKNLPQILDGLKSLLRIEPTRTVGLLIVVT